MSIETHPEDTLTGRIRRRIELKAKVDTRARSAISGTTKEEREKIKKEAQKNQVEQRLNLLHSEIVTKFALYYLEELKQDTSLSPKAQKALQNVNPEELEIAALLHDSVKVGKPWDKVKKEDPGGAANRGLLRHPFTSAQYAGGVLREEGVPEDTIESIIRAIREHAGSPYVEGVAKSYPSLLGETEYQQGHFNPPSSAMAAILFAADLMSAGVPYRKPQEKNPKEELAYAAGGFDKIVAIELGFGKTLLEAIEQAERSWETNVARLSEGLPGYKYPAEKQEGHKIAREIEKYIADKYAPRMREKIRGLKEIVRQGTPEGNTTAENTMEAYYRYARIAADAQET